MKIIFLFDAKYVLRLREEFSKELSTMEFFGYPALFVKFFEEWNVPVV